MTENQQQKQIQKKNVFYNTKTVVQYTQTNLGPKERKWAL